MYVGALHALAILALLYMLLGAFFRDVRALRAHHLPFIQGSVFIVRKLYCTFTFESKENFLNG